MAFVSSSSNNSTNGAVNTTHVVNTANGVSTVDTQVNTANIDNLSDDVICAFLASQPSSPQLVNKDLEHIHPDNLEEMNLKWQMAIAPRAQDNRNRESTRRNVHVKTTNSSALVSCDGLGGYDWSDQAEEGPNYALMAYSTSSSDSEISTDSNYSKTSLETVKLLKSQNEQILKELKKSELMVLGLNKLTDSQIVDSHKKGLGYNAVPPPHTGLFMPSKLDLSYIGLEEFTSKPAVETLNAKTSEDDPKLVKNDDSAPIIKDWKSDDEDESAPQPKIEKKTVKPTVAKVEFVKPKQQSQNARKTVKNVEKSRQSINSKRGNQRN
uniref:Uncharacterized protein n=1 Tax=Tanacetum cinerariifolium TaxID=118510 RepID=A0A6L2KKL1_TANCI|nr:hypothetical protein [Tanacetum cinerariifolium]